MNPVIYETTVAAEVHQNPTNTDISIVSIEEDIDEIATAEVTTVEDPTILKN